MDLFSFIWEKIIVPSPPMAITAILFVGTIFMFIYFKARNTNMLAKINLLELNTKTEFDKLKAEIAISQADLVKRTEVGQIWKELHDIRGSMESGFGIINQQLTQISAAVISAVSNK